MSASMDHFYAPPTLKRTMRAYDPFVSDDTQERIKTAARLLGADTIVHINTSAASGGVAEMLRSQIPVERSLGLDARWLVMRGSESFFEVTKKIHHGLQGKPERLTAQDEGIYLRQGHQCARELQSYLGALKRVVVVLHDPQPLPLIGYIPDDIPVIVRIHPDLSTPHAATLDFLRPFLVSANLLIVSDPGYRPRWFPLKSSRVILPALDPLSVKNRDLSARTVHRVLRSAGIDTGRPLISQISRIDPWKDPLGVIAAYRKAKSRIPDLQLAIAGINLKGRRSRAEKALYDAVVRAAAGDADIHVFGEKEPPAGFSNDIFVNALQRGSTVIVQKSIREGFGLSLTEAMWKRAAVIGGRSTGIRHQIHDGRNGFVVDSVAVCARRMIALVEDESLRERFGESARESVREKFLLPRLIAEHLEVYAEGRRSVRSARTFTLGTLRTQALSQ